MKKSLYLLVLIMITLLISACQENGGKTEETKENGEIYSAVYFQMDSEIRINYMADNQEQANEFKSYIGEIYAMYHSLSDNYSALEVDSKYLENIYSLNTKINENVEIDYELYLLLEESERIKDLTDGYFDVSIGKIVKAWKDVILDPDIREDDYEIPKSVFESLQEQIGLIEVQENPFTLSISDEKYYVRVNHGDVQLDLGAIAKGYATEIVKDYLIENGVIYFAINAGSSTIAVGKNSNPERKNQQWNVELIDPLFDNQYFGLIELRDQSLATSGNNIQYATYNELRYHHIVSPLTKYSEHYYHSLTMIGNDASLLDALSTAFFSMSPETISAWLDTHQEELGIEVILYNYDGTVTTHLLDTIFEGY